MNVFQNILEILRVYRVRIIGDTEHTEVIGYFKTLEEASKACAGHPEYMIGKCQATNIKGEWHLLGNVIEF